MLSHEDDFHESRQLGSHTNGERAMPRFPRDPLREVGKLTGMTECSVDTSAGVQVYANVMESAIVTEGEDCTHPSLSISVDTFRQMTSESTSDFLGDLGNSTSGIQHHPICCSQTIPSVAPPIR